MATMVQAIRMALHVGEDRLGVTDIFGEDVGPPLGGVFTATQGLKTTWNTPLDERGIVGAAIGLALAGQRPVAEIQFCDYAFNTIDLLKLAGAMYWSSNGQWNLPMVVMTPVGSGIHGSIYHSHSFDATATHIPGWKIVIPSTPRDAYGLMLSAIKDPNPVMFLAPKALLRAKALPGEEIPGEPDEKTLSKMIDAPLGDRTAWSPDWPNTADMFIPIGEAKTVRKGRDVTCVTYGRMVQVCTKAAEELASEGIEAEVIDLRTLRPLDMETVLASVRKTNRIVTVEEGWPVCSVASEICARVATEAFDHLDAPPVAVTGADVPMPYAANLEKLALPSVEGVVEAVKSVCYRE
jgi:2-oxoisovalerate dehydrogenase E1 component beta subunit